MSNFDVLTEEILGKSWYALFLVIFGFASNFASSGVMTGSVFLAGIPRSRCYVAPYDNASLHPNLTDDAITQAFVPWNDVTEAPDRCYQNLLNDSWCSDDVSVEDCLTSSEVVGQTACRHGYIYDRTDYEETVVTEWDLVCDRHSLLSFSISLFFVGVGTGSIVGGILSDRFGRLLTIKWGVGITILLGIATAFSPNVIVFSVLRTLEIVFYSHAVLASFTYISEVSPPSWRLPVTLLFNSIFGFGCIVLSALALCWRRWRALQVAYTLIMIAPVFCYSSLLPKSPRWLFARGSVNESKKVCKKIAEKSGKSFPIKSWDEIVEGFKTTTTQTQDKTLNTVKELFARPYSRLQISCNMFVWFVTSLVYYGLALNSGSLAGDPYVNNALGGAMEAVACAAGIFVVKRFGAVRTEVFTLSLAGVVCISSTLVVQLAGDNYGLLMFGTVLALIGRFGVSMCFGVIFVHTAEMFPTAGRTTAVGISSMAGRIGTIITPWTIQLQYTIPWLTQTIFGIISLFGAVAASVLVETKNHDLMMSFPEAEKFYREKLGNSLAQRVFNLPPSSQAQAKEDEQLFEKA